MSFYQNMVRPFVLNWIETGSTRLRYISCIFISSLPGSYHSWISDFIFCYLAYSTKFSFSMSLPPAASFYTNAASRWCTAATGYFWSRWELIRLGKFQEFCWPGSLRSETTSVITQFYCCFIQDWFWVLPTRLCSLHFTVILLFLLPFPTPDLDNLVWNLPIGKLATNSVAAAAASFYQNFWLS